MSDERAEPLTVIELRTAKFEVLAEDLVRVTPSRHEDDVAGARDCVDTVAELRRQYGRKIRLLVDMREVRTLSGEARHEYQSERNTSNLVGVAMVVGSGISRVIANFFIALAKDENPQRAFTSESEARAWLQELPDPSA